MIPGREQISTFAQNAIADGDDLHITGSSDEEEEDYSVICNASEHTRSTILPIPNGNKVVEDGGKPSSLKSMKLLQVFRQLGEKSKALPKKIRNQSSMLRPYLGTVTEYQEIVDDEIARDQNVDESDTNIFNRSSRNNVSTGKSMLMKQKAQVANRPSHSPGNWDSSETKTNTIGRRNYRNLMLRHKSLVFDDSSVGGMSDITEDMSFYGSSRMDLMSSRRTPMFISGQPYPIQEDEDESESGHDSIADEVVKHVYNFQDLSPLNDGSHSTTNLFSTVQTQDDSDIRQHITNATQTNLAITPTMESKPPEIRSEETTDSNDLFEASPDSTLPTQNKPSAIRDSLTSRYCLESGTPASSFLSQKHPASNFGSWPFPRTRTFSDPIARNTELDHEIDTTCFESSPTKHTQVNQHSPLPLEERYSEDGVRFRTYSDSVVYMRSGEEQKEIDWYPPRNLQIELDRTETIPRNSVKEANESPRRGSFPNTSTHSTEIAFFHASNTSSVLATLSRKENHDEGVWNTTRKLITLRDSSVRNPSPRTLNAVNIIAAALRPPRPQSPATLPNTSPAAQARQEIDAYYWERNEKNVGNATAQVPETELKNLCSWSSDSFDDIF